MHQALSAVAGTWSRLNELGSDLSDQEEASLPGSMRDAFWLLFSCFILKKKRGVGDPSGYSRCLDHVLPGVQGAVSHREVTEWIFRGRVAAASAWESTGHHGEVCMVTPWKAAWAGFQALPVASHASWDRPGVRVQGVTGLCPPQGEMLDNIELNVMHTVDHVEKAQEETMYSSSLRRRRHHLGSLP